MRLLAIISLALLGACGPEPGAGVTAALRGLDLTDCPGWSGARPANEMDFSLAASAEMHGRRCANSKLQAVRDFRAAIDKTGPR